METATAARHTAPSQPDNRPRAHDDRHLAIARRVVALLFGPQEERSFAVRYWTGDEEPPLPGAPPAFTLALRDAGSLRRMLLPPGEVTLGRAFVSGAVEVLGNTESATGIAPLVARRVRSAGTLARALRLVLQLPRDADAASAPKRYRPSLRFVGRRHTRGRDADAVRWHYDAGNDFFGLWLDSERVYSCAYFPTGNESLEEAQRAKLDLICRKLRLKPGETLLDIGCGWGGLISHAARHYGVRATGITLSGQQANGARERLREAGLSDRCAVEVADYREFATGRVFDKIASIGMFEHVGASRMREYFREAYRLLRPGGLFLNHGIISIEAARRRSLGQWLSDLAWQRGRFVRRYVFPDGELLPLGLITSEAEAAGFETRDVESLREHYARTLRHWVDRLEARASEAIRLVGEQRYRIWRLYMAASAFGFTSGRLGIVQMLLARQGPGGAVELPLTRGDLYSERG